MAASAESDNFDPSWNWSQRNIFHHRCCLCWQVVVDKRMVAHVAGGRFNCFKCLYDQSQQEVRTLRTQLSATRDGDRPLGPDVADAYADAETLHSKIKELEKDAIRDSETMTFLQNQVLGFMRRIAQLDPTSWEATQDWIQEDPSSTSRSA